MIIFKSHLEWGWGWFWSKVREIGCGKVLSDQTEPVIGELRDHIEDLGKSPYEKNMTKAIVLASWEIWWSILIWYWYWEEI